MKATAARGATSKHAGGGKHHPRAKHTPAKQAYTPKQQRQFARYVATHPQQAKPRQLSLGDVACCTAEALGASLRLAGWPVAPEDVLALHEAAGGSRDRGVPIAAALRAASSWGLAGVRLVSFEPVDLRGLRLFRAGLVLGLELPGAHAVAVGSDGCWLSWGGHHDPSDWPDAVVEEAWVVAWP